MQQASMICENMHSYEPDYASDIDSEEEILADRYGVSIAVAKQIIADRASAKMSHDATISARIIGQLMIAKNPRVMVQALAIAAGLDQLNGAYSQSDIAKELNVSRALLSHYVVGWRDLLSNREYKFDITKMRKTNSARETYAEKSKSPLIAAKNKIKQQLKQK
jgi:predicted transcriptional regulator